MFEWKPNLTLVFHHHFTLISFSSRKFSYINRFTNQSNLSLPSASFASKLWLKYSESEGRTRLEPTFSDSLKIQNKYSKNLSIQ